MILLLILCSWTRVFAGSFSFQSISSDRIEVLGEGSKYLHEGEGAYPAWADFFLKDIFRYSPRLHRKPLSKNCQSGFGQPIKYLEECERELQLDSSPMWIQSYRTMMLDLDLRSHPYGKWVLLTLPDGTRLKGFLAMKSQSFGRPLVIVRLGIFSSAMQFLPERFLFMQLFEQGFANLLVLESSSNAEYIQRNHHLRLGGYDEGIQNLEVAKILKNAKEPISRFVGNLHLMAVSFGGHGALFSAILNDQLRPSPLTSVVAFCPLVNLQDTFSHHSPGGQLPGPMEYWVQKRMRFKEAGISIADGSTFTESFVGWLKLNYQPSKSSLQIPQLETHRQKSQDDFWKLNQFWEVGTIHKTPTLILANQEDPLVPFALNSAAFQKLESRNYSVQLHVLKQGVHCTVPGAYDWFGFSQFLNGWLKSHESKNQFRVQRKEFQLNSKALKIDDWTVLVKPGESQIHLRVKLNSGRHEFEISATETDFGTPKISNYVEARMIERWAMQNFNLGIHNQTLQVSWENFEPAQLQNFK